MPQGVRKVGRWKHERRNYSHVKTLQEIILCLPALPVKNANAIVFGNLNGIRLTGMTLRHYSSSSSACIKSGNSSSSQRLPPRYHIRF
ncbi:unnamed protein product [Fusarium graminearum]|uniref:Uncharacterized protein n=1 Tax=Gibberella zeae TaxID=5518 RepID=A0A4E9DVM8_GIBZA|nr:unnamed protein product [Fusarium graminearum]CAF3552547.1 unnamed protein product [Fusarium graminearum]CAG1962357.1 unnamed protein product [Fusarium graminearum]CAG2008025.1 unnamed protein product [Fusarium graminearum]